MHDYSSEIAVPTLELKEQVVIDKLGDLDYARSPLNETGEKLLRSLRSRLLTGFQQ